MVLWRLALWGGREGSKVASNVLVHFLVEWIQGVKTGLNGMATNEAIKRTKLRRRPRCVDESRRKRGGRMFTGLRIFTVDQRKINDESKVNNNYKSR